MLPAVHRLRHRDEFTATFRHGRRAAGPLLVVHCAVAVTDHPPRAGFVVARPVGSAVVRNRVRRRLRHLVAHRLDRLPQGAALIVRVLPPAAAASSAELGRALDTAFDRVAGPAVAGHR